MTAAQMPHRHRFSLVRCVAFGVCLLGASAVITLWVASADSVLARYIPSLEKARALVGAVKGRAVIQVWVDRPIQRVSDDSWEVSFLGFGLYYTGTYVEPGYMRLHGNYWVCIVPLWFLLLVLSSYPVFFVGCALLRRPMRRRRGLCLECGYNLRGNVSGRCPECGTQTGLAPVVISTEEARGE